MNIDIAKLCEALFEYDNDIIDIKQHKADNTIEIIKISNERYILPIRKSIVEEYADMPF